MKNDSVLRHGGTAALTLALTMAMVLAACGDPASEVAATPPVVAVMTVKATRLEVTEDLPARVSAVRVAEIRPQVSGIVQRRLFEQGTEVRSGQGLFQINPAPFKADLDTAAANLLRAEAALTRARTQVERLQPLLENDAVSGQAYDDAVSQRDQAVADVSQARASLTRKQIDLKFALVEAPISGRIDQALVTEGALVGSNDASPMARIQQIDQVYVDVRRPASSLEALRKAVAAQHGSTPNGLPVTVLDHQGEPYDVKGHILFSGINVDAGTGDVLLRVLVDNPRRQLLPGMFVRARVPYSSHAEALMVPQQAVVRVGGKPQIWTLDAQGIAKSRMVELGELVDRHYRVRVGLTAGDKVVVEGMERLSDGATVTAQDWKSDTSVALPTGTSVSTTSAR